MKHPTPLYFCCAAQGWQHFASADWGDCRRYIEVGRDQLDIRQIEVYRNGQVLLYDRQRARDDFGMLIGLRFSKKQKWQALFSDVELLGAAEFERLWKVYSGKSRQKLGVDGRSSTRFAE